MLTPKEIPVALSGFGRAAVGWAATSAARCLFGPATNRMTVAPIKAFGCVAASKSEQSRPSDTEKIH